MMPNNKLIYIKLTDPSKEDIEYTKMLLNNWNNYYKPENYLLPNTEIIEPGDHKMTSTQEGTSHQESQD